MKTIQKIKCRLGWHKWHYGYMDVPELGLVAIRTCLNCCWRNEIINAATGGWDHLIYNEDKKVWEGV